MGTGKGASSAVQGLGGAEVASGVEELSVAGRRGVHGGTADIAVEHLPLMAVATLGASKARVDGRSAPSARVGSVGAAASTNSGAAAVVEGVAAAIALAMSVGGIAGEVSLVFGPTTRLASGAAAAVPAVVVVRLNGAGWAVGADLRNAFTKTSA